MQTVVSIHLHEKCLPRPTSEKNPRARFSILKFITWFCFCFDFVARSDTFKQVRFLRSDKMFAKRINFQSYEWRELPFSKKLGGLVGRDVCFTLLDVLL